MPCGEPMTAARALIAGAILASAILAGCASPGAGADGALTLNRQIRVTIDNRIADMGDDVDPYDVITSSFIVRVGATPLAPAAATIVYQDRAGATVTRPLTDFVQATQLTQGMEVVIDDANLTSDAQLLVDGVVVASRARPPVDWWNVGGYPIGVRMDPGAKLSYRATGDATEAFALRDIEPTEDAPQYRVDLVEASIGFTYDATLDLSLAETPERVEATSAHDARALAWSVTGSGALPARIEARGTDLANGTTVEAGIESLAGTKADFDARGKLWWNLTGSPVRADLDGGSTTTKADVIAWLTGYDLEDFSCSGKTRADQCRPTEMDLEGMGETQTIDASQEELDAGVGAPEMDVVANLTRFLSEDLVPGDQLRFDIDLDSTKMEDPDLGPTDPERILVRGSAALRAVGYERVTVAAGDFDAIKVVEQVDLRVEVGPTRDEDGKLVLNDFLLDQRLVDTTFWLAKDTFAPLRIHQTTPFDFGKVIDDLLAAMPEDAWTDAAVQRITGENIDLTIEATSTFELTQASGASRFSPWAILLGFNSVGAMPAALAWGGGMGGFASPAEPAFPVPGGDGADYEYEYEYEVATLTLSSAGPIENGSKEYVVAAVSDDAEWYRFSFELDAEPLFNGETPGWCVVVDGECEMWSFDTVEAGDVVRITADELEGRTLVVRDLYTDEVVFGATVL